MSKLFRKFSLVIALLLLVTIVFSGCSNDNEETEGTKSGSATSIPVDPVTNEPLEPVTIHWYNISSQPVEDSERDKVLNEVNKVLKEKLNTTLKYYLLDSGSFEDKINVKFSGGDPIDLCYSSLGWVNKYPQGVASGKFLELDEILSKYGKNILAATEQRFWDCAKVQGKTYAIMNVQNYAYGQGIMFQKALVEELGLQQDVDNLKYLEDLGVLLGKVKVAFEKDPKYSKYRVLGNPPNMPTKMQEAEQEDIPGTPFSVMRGDNEMNPIIAYATDFGKYNLNIKREWYQKGYITSEAAVVKSWSEVFRKGKLFCTSADSTKPGDTEEHSLRYGMPLIIKETRTPVLRTHDILASLTVIAKNSENPERAMMVADLLFTDIPTYNTLVWGIKDVHYTMAGENIIKLTDEQKNYSPMNHWAAGNNFNAYLTDKEDPKRWEETKERNKNAVFATTFGFVLDTTKYQAEYAQMSEIITRNFRQLNSGLTDVDKQLEKLDTELKNLGYEKLYEDVKEQLKKFKDSKPK